jgi:hypothetical protein
MELTNTNMDIFESSSAPASPRPSPPRSPPNVDVDTSLPPAKEAFAYFLGQAFSIPAGNFSDSLTRRPVGLSGRDNSGFSGVPTRNIAGESFEVGPPSKSEGVIDRLNRLTAEVMDIEAMITQYSAGPAVNLFIFHFSFFIIFFFFFLMIYIYIYYFIKIPAQNKTHKNKSIVGSFGGKGYSPQ